MDKRDVVVIGGSFGATASLKQLLPRRSGDLPAAIFDVLHSPGWGIAILPVVEQATAALRAIQDIVTELCVYAWLSSASKRLVWLASQVLVEWEKHRSLIAQRSISGGAACLPQGRRSLI